MEDNERQRQELTRNSIMTSSYLLKLLNSTRNGSVRASVKNLLADVEFRCDLEKLKTQLHSLKLRTDKAIDIELKGETVDVVGSAFLKAVANLFKGPLIGCIEDAIKESVEEALEGVQMTS